MKERQIPFSPPDIREEDIEKVAEVLRSGWITTGPKTKAFEKALTSSMGTAGTVCLSSDTAALESALRLFGIGPGDQVLVPAYTYTASASVILHVGAEPVFVDSKADDPHMDLSDLEKKMTEKTRAILPVDLAGVMEDYEEIYRIIEEKKSLFHPKTPYQEALGRVLVLADGAHSLGARQKGKISGQAADFTCFSFHAVKNLTTAEGGAVTWKKGLPLDNEDIYKTFQLLSLHGQSKDALAKTRLGGWEYDIILPAYKCNMTDIQAALGLSQLSRYEEILKRRAEIVRRYDCFFKEECGFSPLAHWGESFDSSRHLYLLSLSSWDGEKRNEFIQKMGERGVSTNVHYKPLPMMSAYQNLGYSIGDYPRAYDYFIREVTLPLHTKLSDDDISYVISSAKEVLGTMGAYL